MPTFRKRRQTKRHRRPRTYRRKTYRKTLRKNNTSLVPSSFVTKLVYAETVSLGLAIASANAHLFKANGMFDPNQTGTGHQPLGFDQLMTLYSDFKVIGSKITCLFENVDPNASIQVGITPINNSTTVLTTPDRYKEIRNTVFGFCQQHDVGPSCKTLVNKISMKKFMGEKLFDEDYQGNASADPTKSVYWHLWAQPLDAAADITTCNIAVKVEYIVKFSEPKLLAQS